MVSRLWSVYWGVQCFQLIDNGVYLPVVVLGHHIIDRSQELRHFGFLWSFIHIAVLVHVKIIFSAKSHHCCCASNYFPEGMLMPCLHNRVGLASLYLKLRFQSLPGELVSRVCRIARSRHLSRQVTLLRHFHVTTLGLDALPHRPSHHLVPTHPLGHFAVARPVLHPLVHGPSGGQLTSHPGWHLAVLVARVRGQDWDSHLRHSSHPGGHWSIAVTLGHPTHLGSEHLRGALGNLGGLERVLV